VEESGLGYICELNDITTAVDLLDVSAKESATKNVEGFTYLARSTPSPLASMFAKSYCRVHDQGFDTKSI
jgi:hypothetical protein